MLELNKELYTVAEASKILGLSITIVRRLAKNKVIPASRTQITKGHYLFTKRALQSYWLKLNNGGDVMS